MVRLTRLLFAVALALSGAGVAQTMPRVVQVRPSAMEVPANLLRISIEFAAPVGASVLSRLTLMHDDGRQVEEPFLRQELWSPGGKILTVLMHPGRVKTGLNARDEMGPILAAGDHLVLALDGHPIQRWSVVAAAEHGPVPSAWRLSAVSVGSRQALVVRLDQPIDGRDADYLAVADSSNRRVEGQAQLRDGERVWTFTPRRPWRSGTYSLLARATLEDAAGNRLGSRFETATSTPRESMADAVVVFTVGL